MPRKTDPRQQRFDFSGDLGKRPEQEAYDHPARPPPTWWQRLAAWAGRKWRKAWVWMIEQLKALPGTIMRGIIAYVVMIAPELWASRRLPPTPPPAPAPIAPIKRPPAVIEPFSTETLKRVD